MSGDWIEQFMQILSEVCTGRKMKRALNVDLWRWKSLVTGFGSLRCFCLEAVGHECREWALLNSQIPRTCRFQVMTVPAEN